MPDTTHGDIDLNAWAFWAQHPDESDKAFAVLREDPVPRNGISSLPATWTPEK